MAMTEGVDNPETPGRVEFLRTFEGMKASEVVEAEIISRLTDSIIHGSPDLVRIEYDFWMGLLEKAKVNPASLTSYKQEGNIKIDSILNFKNYPTNGGNRINVREDAVLRTYALDNAKELFALILKHHFMASVPYYWDELYQRSRRRNPQGELPVNHLISGLKVNRPFSKTEVDDEYAGKPFVTFDIMAAYAFPQKIVTKFIREAFGASAKYLSEHGDVAGLYVDSWIVASNPKRIEGMGFTVLYTYKTNAAGARVIDTEIPARRAYMSREECIRRYLRSA